MFKKQGRGGGGGRREIPLKLKQLNSYFHSNKCNKPLFNFRHVAAGKEYTDMPKRRPQG